jgi:hypothetical protein
MTEDTDRIAVPTNGQKPHPVAPLAPLRGEPPTADARATERTRPFSPTDPALLGAVSPKQLAVGMGIVASLILLALGRSRIRRGR